MWGRFRPKVDLWSTFVSAAANRVVQENVSSELFFKYKTSIFRTTCLLKHKKFISVEFFDPYAKMIRLPLKPIMITYYFLMMCIFIYAYLRLDSYIIILKKILDVKKKTSTLHAT